MVRFSGLTRHRTSVRIWSCVRVSLGQIWRAHDRARGNGEMEGGVWLWRQCRLAQGAQQAQRARKPARARTVRSSSKGDDQRLLPEPGDQKAPLIEHDGSLVADISHIPNDLKITIQGAREHNLKNVDLAIPRNRMVVFTGLSGSGKSSLAFDTLFAEDGDATSNPYPPTPASSWVRWTSPTLTSSRA